MKLIEIIEILVANYECLEADVMIQVLVIVGTVGATLKIKYFFTFSIALRTAFIFSRW